MATRDGSCWICGSARANPYKSGTHDRALDPTDFEITNSRYGSTLTLSQCQDCGFIHAADDEIGQLDSLYERMEDPAYESSQDSRAYQMDWLLRRVMRLRPGARTLLDVGAGAGVLVRQARNIGLDAVGIEPSRSLARSAARVNGVDLLQGFFPHPGTENRTFDIVAIVDVIEHVSEPVALLRDAGNALTPDGMLLVVTPDVSSLAARLLKGRWWHFRLAHVGYFSRATLARAADRAGLREVHVCRPKWFFRIEYLAAQLQRYLPIGFVNRLAPRLPAGGWLYSRVVPVNLHDSLAIFLQRQD